MRILIASLLIVSASAACECPFPCLACVFWNATASSDCTPCTACYSDETDENGYTLLTEDCEADNNDDPSADYTGVACEEATLTSYAPVFCKGEAVAAAVTVCGTNVYYHQVELCAAGELEQNLDNCHDYEKYAQYTTCLTNETADETAEIASDAADEISDQCRTNAVRAQEQTCYDAAAKVQNDGCIATATTTIAEANILAYATHYGGLVELAQAYGCDNSGKTYSPTARTSAPTVVTTTPTVRTKVPTARTSAPSSRTSAPTVTTKAPTGAPTKTQAPTVVTGTPVTVNPTGTPVTSGPSYAKAPSKAPTTKHPSAVPVTAAPTTGTKAPTVRTTAPTGTPTTRTKTPTSRTVSPTVRSKAPTARSKAPTTSPTKTPTSRTSSPTSSPTTTCESKANSCKNAFVAHFASPFPSAVVANETLNATLLAADCTAASSAMLIDFYYQSMTCYLNNATCALANATLASVTGVYASETKARLDAAGLCASNYQSVSCEQFGVASDTTTSQTCYTDDEDCKAKLTARSYNSDAGQCSSETIIAADVCNASKVVCMETFYGDAQQSCTETTINASKLCVTANTACENYFDEDDWTTSTSSNKTECEQNGSGAADTISNAISEVTNLGICMGPFAQLFGVPCPTTAQNTSRWTCYDDYVACNASTSDCYDETIVKVEETCYEHNEWCAGNVSYCFYIADNTTAISKVASCQADAALCTYNYFTLGLVTPETNLQCNESSLDELLKCSEYGEEATALTLDTDGADTNQGCEDGFSEQCAEDMAAIFGGGEEFTDTLDFWSKQCNLEWNLCKKFMTSGGYKSGDNDDSVYKGNCDFFDGLSVYDDSPYKTLEDQIDAACVEDNDFEPPVPKMQVFGTFVSTSELSDSKVDIICDEMALSTADESGVPLAVIEDSMTCNQTASSRRRLLEEPTDEEPTTWTVNAYMEDVIVTLVNEQLTEQGKSVDDIAEVMVTLLEAEGIDVTVEVIATTEPPTKEPTGPAPTTAPTPPTPAAPEPTAAAPTSFSAGHRLAPSIIALSSVLLMFVLV